MITCRRFSFTKKKGKYDSERKRIRYLKTTPGFSLCILQILALSGILNELLPVKGGWTLAVKWTAKVKQGFSEFTVQLGKTNIYIYRKYNLFKQEISLLVISISVIKYWSIVNVKARKAYMMMMLFFNSRKKISVLIWLLQDSSTTSCPVKHSSQPHYFSLSSWNTVIISVINIFCIWLLFYLSPQLDWVPEARDYFAYLRSPAFGSALSPYLLWDCWTELGLKKKFTIKELIHTIGLEQ